MRAALATCWSFFLDLSKDLLIPKAVSEPFYSTNNNNGPCKQRNRARSVKKRLLSATPDARAESLRSHHFLVCVVCYTPFRLGSWGEHTMEKRSHAKASQPYAHLVS